MSGLIVSRAQWGAAPARPGTPRTVDEVTDTFIHYTDVHENIPTASEASEAAIVRAIQAHHMATGYVDIAYEGLVGFGGNIYEGRASDIWDGSTCNNNRNGYGLCFLTDGLITHPQGDSMRFAVALGRLHFPNMARVPLPHSSQCPTACPGNEIRRWINHQKW
jgi:hypothetical protein